MIVKQNALSLSLANAISVSFPAPEWEWWHKYHSKDSFKLGSKDRLRFPRACQIGLDQLALSVSDIVDNEWPNGFIDFEWHAGGMHSMPPGGYLESHLDADKHPTKSWKRIGSIVWFANKEWKKEWGGCLKVKDREFIPEFNTAIAFSCNDESWHEVAKNTGPEYRNTLALFVWEDIDGYESKRESAEFK
jgi:hypothetical protein